MANAIADGIFRTIGAVGIAWAQNDHKITVVVPPAETRLPNSV